MDVIQEPEQLQLEDIVVKEEYILSVDVPEKMTSELEDPEHQEEQDIGTVHIRKRIRKQNMASSTSYICCKCKLSFNSKYIYLNHLKTHTKSFKSFLCLKCNIKFDSKKKLQLHSDEHLFENGKLRCPKCGLMYSSRRSLRKHTESHSVRFIECLFCITKFKSQELVEQHMEKVHPGFPRNIEDAIAEGKLFNVDRRRLEEQKRKAEEHYDELQQSMEEEEDNLIELIKVEEDDFD